MTTYIYKGQEINHTSFISILRSAGINGGRKLTHYQVLEREAANGNEKAIEILKNLIIKEETIVKKYKELMQNMDIYINRDGDE